MQLSVELLVESAMLPSYVLAVALIALLMLLSQQALSAGPVLACVMLLSYVLAVVLSVLLTYSNQTQLGAGLALACAMLLRCALAIARLALLILNLLRFAGPQQETVTWLRHVTESIIAVRQMQSQQRFAELQRDCVTRLRVATA
jgi:hypothetical protein